jgi:hypothetical protein
MQNYINQSTYIVLQVDNHAGLMQVFNITGVIFLVHNLVGNFRKELVIYCLGLCLPTVVDSS